METLLIDVWKILTENGQFPISNKDIFHDVYQPVISSPCNQQMREMSKYYKKWKVLSYNLEDTPILFSIVTLQYHPKIQNYSRIISECFPFSFMVLALIGWSILEYYKIYVVDTLSFLPNCNSFVTDKERFRKLCSEWTPLFYIHFYV